MKVMTRASAQAVRLLLLSALMACIGAGCGEEEAMLQIESVLCARDTCDSSGPYKFEAVVSADLGVRAVSLRLYEYPGDDSAQIAVPFEMVEGDSKRGLWQASLPGQVPGTVVYYAVELIDGDSTVTYAPKGPPYTLYCFRVLSPSECVTRDITEGCNLCEE